MLNKYFAYSLIFVCIDQITKAIFATRDFFIWGMHFHLIKNYGLSFGLDLGKFNLIIVVVALILLLVYFPKSVFYKFNLGIALLISGALSNLADRVYLGYVRDFWDLGLGFAFNLADLFIVAGLVAILLSSPPAGQEKNEGF